MNNTVSDKKITVTDIVIIVFVILATVLSLLLLTKTEGASTEALIKTKDGTTAVSLEKDSTFTFESDGYTYTVEVTDGNISVTEADCPDKTCVNTHPVGKRNGVICCVPGGLIISCNGNNEKGDADFQIP